MYYAHFILNKKGPLAKIWLAAHWDKKLTKAQIYETNIESTIETILEPQMKLALRTSGHLLLGVCRIYSRKVKYLLADCNEAFVKIKLAFRPGLIDLPKEKQQASIEAITLPEKFPDFFVNFNDINIEDMDLSKATAQQARVEDITLKEDFGTFVAMQDDDFGDMGSFGMGMDMDTFMMSDMEKGRRVGDSLVNQNDIDFFDDPMNNQSDFASELQDVSKQNENNGNDIQPMEMTELNSELRTDPIDSTAFNSNLENPVADEMTQNDTIMQELHDQEPENNEMTIPNVTDAQPGVVPTLFDEQPTVNNTNLADEPADKMTKLGDINEEDEEPKETQKSPEQNENHSPVDDSKKNETIVAAPIIEKQIKNRRRRKIVIDEVKEIDSATMKLQLSDTSAISSSLELAPPTRKLMHLKETGGVDKLLSMTSRPFNNKNLLRLYTRNMTTKTLTDITNLNKPNKESITVVNSTLINNEITLDKDTTIEANMDANQSKNNVLPLADSFIDTNNDVSKQGPIDDVTLDNGIEQLQADVTDKNNQLDEIDNLGGPVSIYNSNIDEISISDMKANPVNLEVTPTKDDKKEKSDSEEEEDEGEETETKVKGKYSSPNSKKRSYRKSTNQLKDTTVRDEEELDETLTSDPSKNLTKRAKTMVSILNKSLAKNDNVGFFELIRKNGRKNVVQKFYSLLVLTKYEIIDVTQEESYDDIIISKGDKFESMTH
ncbi:unnamed protein product [Brachionus calyciflorus]|uniref:Uncharacterized protein n=1 Tax=Brachionus calyciflorus TaxID=104777 RepID=A0A813XED6_9BILA|nr:unnamed protein product [Brachionus calyciflorus]